MPSRDAWLDRYTFGKHQAEWRLIFVGLFAVEFLIFWLLQSQCVMPVSRGRWLVVPQDAPGGGLVQCLTKSPETFLLNMQEVKKNPLDAGVVYAIGLPIWFLTIPYGLYAMRKNREKM